MNIFIDIDYTMISGHDNSLRPNVSNCLRHLSEQDHRLFAWSGDTPRRHLLAELDILQYFEDVLSKPTRDFRNLASFITDVPTEFVVDDYPQIVRVFGGINVTAYTSYDDTDEAFLRVTDLVELHQSLLRCNEENDVWIYEVSSIGVSTKHICCNSVFRDS